MVELIKRKKLEKYIKFFLDNMCINYPFYIDNLSENLELSNLSNMFYNLIDLPISYEYKTNITLSESINIVSEILESISSNLKERFIKEIDNGNISFDEKDYSYLDFQDDKYYIGIKDTNNTATTLFILHEFFHLLHLEQLNYEGENENYYCYTETLGMSGEFYALLYLLDNKEYLKDDLLAYIHELIYRLGIKARDSFIDGILISIYNEENSLSRTSLKKYVEKNNLPLTYLDVLKDKPCAKLDYYEDIRYIYSLPRALVFSYNLYNEQSMRNNFENIISDLSKMHHTEWENKYIIPYIYNEEILIILANNLLNIINKLYNKDAKIKKIGEI